MGDLIKCEDLLIWNPLRRHRHAKVAPEIAFVCYRQAKLPSYPAVEIYELQLLLLLPLAELRFVMIFGRCYSFLFGAQRTFLGIRPINQLINGLHRFLLLRMRSYIPVACLLMVIAQYATRVTLQSAITRGLLPNRVESQ